MRAVRAGVAFNEVVLLRHFRLPISAGAHHQR
jgi:hypothetical protein